MSSPALLNGTDRPFRFVYCDERGKFRLDSKALATLQLLKGPVGVVSVCGRARQGKSFILNLLLGRTSGFQVAPTHRPCTKGLWLWILPLKMTALHGSEYSLILLDSEGIDAYDQTPTYSTQIFSLAVLLSSMFIYNQMGGIDEAALDSLSPMNEITKHITASELEQFTPIFVWLLRDFYLDLTEDTKKISPRDYLELALRPVLVSGKDVASKNEIRDSIRALFPDRECFTLVRPLNNESDLQQMCQIPHDELLDKLRPEFKQGLDDLTRFVFERTRPKQIGATIMNGPMLAGLTQSFLVALNQGAVPTITSCWQSVEGTECRRAYDSATEEYMSSLDHSKPPEEEALSEAHEAAVQKALSMFNASAVGAGSTRQKFEKLLHTFLKKAFEDYKKKSFMEADMLCTNVVQNMEKRLRRACNATDAKLEHVLKLIDEPHSNYEKLPYGPGKWRKLATFLHQSLVGPIADLVRKQINQIAANRSSLSLTCRSIEDKMNLLTRLLKEIEEFKADNLKLRNEKKKVADEYMSHITTLQNKCSSLETAESKVESCGSKMAVLEFELKNLSEKLESANTIAQLYQREAKIFEQMYQSELARSGEVQERCKAAEKEVKRATEVADKARSEAAVAQKKNEIQLTTLEMLTQIDKYERQINDMMREKNNLAGQIDALRNSEMDANAKMRHLEAQAEEREKEIESLIESNKQRADTVQVLESLLETERVARAEANRGAETLSHQLQVTLGELDMVRLNESALDAKLKTRGKRSRVDEHDDVGVYSDVNGRGKRRKSTLSSLSLGDGDSAFTTGENDSQSSRDYTKFTVVKLKEELTKQDFGDELLKLKAPVKKQHILALYEKYILKKL